MNINFKKKDLFLVSAIAIFVIAVSFVIAYNSSPANPAVMGHSCDEIVGGCGGGGGAIKWVQIINAENSAVSIPAGTDKIIITTTAQMYDALPGDAGETLGLDLFADGVQYGSLEEGAGNNNGAQARIWASTTGVLTVTGKSSVSLDANKTLYNHAGTKLASYTNLNYNPVASNSFYCYFKSYVIYGI